MKILTNSFIIGCSCFLLACGQNNADKTASSADTTKVAVIEKAEEKTYAVSLVDNKKDPSCGMPVTAGITDTAHYENKVLGFCSTECKNEFLKNPKATLAAAELK
jgi:YHS domain-containing protein